MIHTGQPCPDTLVLLRCRISTIAPTPSHPSHLFLLLHLLLLNASPHPFALNPIPLAPPTPSVSPLSFALPTITNRNTVGNIHADAFIEIHQQIKGPKSLYSVAPCPCTVGGAGNTTCPIMEFQPGFTAQDSGLRNQDSGLGRRKTDRQEKLKLRKIG